MWRSSFLLLALAAGALGEGKPFGRFGYDRFAPVPGVRLDLAGASIRTAGAERLLWERPLPDWKPVAISDVGATYFHVKENPGGPTKTRVDLTAPGFAARFEAGMRVRIRSTSAPYLSWAEGSVSDGVPTPAVLWAVLSYRSDEPAWVVGFDAPTSLSLTGRPGDWTLSVADDFRGWVRFAPLRGIQSVQANSASTLGRLAKEAAAHAPLWRATAPRLLERTEWAGPASVAIRYGFDRPGALLPAWLTLVPFAGTRPKVDGETLRIPGETEEGPAERSVGTSVAVRIAAAEMPPGRAIGTGDLAPAPASVSGFDLPSVVGSAFAVLDARTATETLTAALAASDEFFGEAPNVKEPFTGGGLPFAADGTGADLLAAHSLLRSATATARASAEGPGPLSLSLGWRRDWSSGRLAGASDELAARAGGLASLAGAVGRTAAARVDGALWEMGLIARRGLVRWRARGGKTVVPIPEPLPALRAALYGRTTRTADAEFLLSSIRAIGAPPIVADGEGGLRWPTDGKPGGFLVSAALAGLVPADNLVELRLTPLSGAIDLTYLPLREGSVLSRYGNPIGPRSLPLWEERLPTGKE